VNQPEGAHAVGQRVEQLLEKLAGTGNPAAMETAEELVGSLLEFYGAGLARMIELVEETSDGKSTMRRFTEDGFVAGLLALHELHPEDTEQRVHNALEKVRPYLGSHSGDVELLGVDDEGVVHLKLGGSCDGCPSSLVTVKMAIEKGIQEVAPEVTGIEVEGVVEEPTAPAGRQLLPLVSCPVPEAG
jgi:Fe-S cluster biogenesis protein NfuA